jgi:hypothetical protein
LFGALAGTASARTEGFLSWWRSAGRSLCVPIEIAPRPCRGTALILVPLVLLALAADEPKEISVAMVQEQTTTHSYFLFSLIDSVVE